MRHPERSASAFPLAGLLLWAIIENAAAGEIEPLGSVVKNLLGTTKAFKKQVDVDGESVTLFYSKDAKGRPSRVAFIEKGVYEPNCSHTWGIGLDAVTGRVTEVRVHEMGCPHAFPAKSASFLGQYQDKSAADLPKLDSQIQTIAKATGTCKLTTDAVKRSITRWSKVRSQL